MKCKFCDGDCRKAGRQKNGSQKLYCKACGKYQQAIYQNNAFKKDVQVMIPQLVRESVSIRGIARLLKIAVRMVINGIRRVAKAIVKPPVLVQRSLRIWYKIRLVRDTTSAHYTRRFTRCRMAYIKK